MDSERTAKRQALKAEAAGWRALGKAIYKRNEKREARNLYLCNTLFYWSRGTGTGEAIMRPHSVSPSSAQRMEKRMQDEVRWTQPTEYSSFNNPWAWYYDIDALLDDTRAYERNGWRVMMCEYFALCCEEEATV